MNNSNCCPIKNKPIDHNSSKILKISNAIVCLSLTIRVIGACFDSED